MPRAAGIGAIKNRDAVKARFAEKTTAMADAQLVQLTDQMNKFRLYLEEFAAKHKEKIKKNPEFRAQFQAMCATIGVDPLASSKGFWSEMLGVGDFYYQLGVKIIEICMATSHRNGGLMDLEELCTLLNKSRSSVEAEISQDDIIRAVRKLSILGNGFTLVTLGSHQFVQSVPGEMNMDQTRILGLAETRGGHVSASVVCQELSWGIERTLKALSVMVKEGIAWVDDGGQGGSSTREYWFTSLYQSLHREERKL